MSQPDRARHLRRLHSNGPLVLPNAWDAASARVIELAGAAAIATTSAGVAWAYGRGDGQKLSRDEMIRAVRVIVAAVEVPVTADVEGGYGTGSVQDVVETVQVVIEAGAAGINLEDSPGWEGKVLLSPEVHAERIQAAREAAVAAGGDLVINARTDVYLAQAGAPESRFEATVARANLYRAAGADCLFVPGVIDAETIGALVKAIDGPLNILVRPGALSVPELAQLGVARISTGSALAAAVLARTQEAAREILGLGTYGALENGLTYGELNEMFAR